eukprot:28350-Hanusia_phi.AAC.2
MRQVEWTVEFTLLQEYMSLRFDAILRSSLHCMSVMIPAIKLLHHSLRKDQTCKTRTLLRPSNGSANYPMYMLPSL